MHHASQQQNDSGFSPVSPFQQNNLPSIAGKNSANDPGMQSLASLGSPWQIVDFSLPRIAITRISENSDQKLLIKWLIYIFLLWIRRSELVFPYVVEIMRKVTSIKFLWYFGEFGKCRAVVLGYKCIQNKAGSPFQSLTIQHTLGNLYLSLSYWISFTMAYNRSSHDSPISHPEKPSILHDDSAPAPRKQTATPRKVDHHGPN